VPDAPFTIYASPGAGAVPLRWLASFGANNDKVMPSVIRFPGIVA
jgi:hypothetical protein